MPTRVPEGLGAAMDLQITFERGRVVQNNFNNYPMMRLRNAPPVDVQFKASTSAPTGLGEPSVPPVLLALCNAIFAATGDRVRTLPLSLSGYRWA